LVSEFGFGAALAAITAVIMLCGCAAAFAQDGNAATAPVCGGAAVADGTVNGIRDGRTLTLDDGRAVRLAAIDVPLLPSPQGAGATAGRWGAAAKDALDALAGGDRLLLRFAQADPDRYGRIVAYAYTERDSDQAADRLFVQGELIAAGLARVADRVGGQACATALLARENAARKAKLGLWADPYYDLLDAEAPADVLAHKGQFTLVEGKVVSVRESGPTIYLNFGQRWSEDFAVTVRKRNERIFADAGLDLKGLEGRRVIVRGFVEARGSRGMPAIEAERAEQIETADRD
jgi:endonuclease YncB( thermonuclease family)